ncbi:MULTISPECIES: NAD-dependent succinate-semialdehyde dehydrogenase [Achromobacter]|uniref:NAD-dependent succinate-semialdehyde dehydrogenase n=1 Tax=Achromobacter sp. TaxID=134375 RepID=UPI002F952890
MNGYPKLVKLCIAGEWREGGTGRRLPIEGPATGEAIGEVAMADSQDLEEAAAAAQAAWPAWKSFSAYDRYGILRRAAGLLRERAEHIAGLITREQGKPLREASQEVAVSADFVDWVAEEGRRSYGRVVPSRLETVRQSVLKEPVGPVAAFTPWNFPVSQVVRKLAAALAAGCTVVVKAPEETPASPAALVQAFLDAGVPVGSVSLVYGDPAHISEYLIAHPAIAKVSFTGSTAVGKRLAMLAGQHMKRATMELGGHAPVIICDDVDLSKVVPAIATSKFRNAGQVCSSPTRFLVQRGVHEAFVERLVDFARGLRVGNGEELGTDMGPLVNRRRLASMQRMVRDAVEHGARLVQGGQAIEGKGCFFQPTVLASVPLEASAMNEEPFGPMALVNPFDDLESAIAEANRLPVGLAAFAFTQSLARAHEISAGVRSGMISLNHPVLGLPEVPFGGVRESGYGAEGGTEVVENYLVTKLLTQGV